MKKMFSVMVVLLVGIASLVCLMQRESNDDVIRVGVLLPLTGSYSNEGSRGRMAMQMAAAEINSMTNRRYRIDLIVEDDKYTGRDSLNAANKILLQGVESFISFGTPPTQAIKDRIDREGIPLLAMDGSAGLAASSKWIFECFPQLFDVGVSAGRFASKAFSPSETALLTMRCSGGDDFARGLQKEIHGNVTRDVYEPDAQDVRSQIAKLLSRHPKVFCVFGYGAGYETAMSQLLGSSYKGIVLTDSNVTSILNRIGCFKTTIYFVSQNYGPASTSALCHRFIENMKAEYGVEPTVFSAHLYEMVKMLSWVAERSSKSKTDIRSGLANLRGFPSMFGSLSFDSEGSVHLPFSVMKCTTGQIEYVEGGEDE